MYIQRAIEPTIRAASKDLPAVMLAGPRGSGKTTTLRTISGKERTYVSLEDEQVRALARSDPKEFLRQYKGPLILDEIQNAPELLPHLAALAGSSKRMGLFWLTSSGGDILPAVRSAFGSKAAFLTLLGFSDAEIYDYESVPYTTSSERLMKRVEACPERDLREIFSRIFTGSFPELYANPEEEPAEFYEAYVNALLQDEFREIVDSGNEPVFRRFLTVTASNAARPLILEEMARSCAISVPTLERWLDLLKDAHLIQVVEPFSDPGLKRTLRISVMHFLDTGLAAHLLKWNDPVSLENGYNAAAFYETHVYEELLKSYLNAGRVPEFTYYKDKDRRELALILEEEGRLAPINIKMSATPAMTTLRNFKALDPLRSPSLSGSPAREMEDGNILCPARELHPLDADTWVVPSWLI